MRPKMNLSFIQARVKDVLKENLSIIPKPRVPVLFEGNDETFSFVECNNIKRFKGIKPAFLRVTEWLKSNNIGPTISIIANGKQLWILKTHINANDSIDLFIFDAFTEKHLETKNVIILSQSFSNTEIKGLDLVKASLLHDGTVLLKYYPQTFVETIAVVLDNKGELSESRVFSEEGFFLNHYSKNVAYALPERILYNMENEWYMKVISIHKKSTFRCPHWFKNGLCAAMVRFDNYTYVVLYNGKDMHDFAVNFGPNMYKHISFFMRSDNRLFMNTANDIRFHEVV